MYSRPTCVVLVLVVAAATCKMVEAQETAGMRAAFRLYDECSRAPGFVSCLKKKALVFLDRLSRMERINVAEGVNVVRADDASLPVTQPLTDDEIEKNLARSMASRDTALNQLLVERLAAYVSSRTLQFTLPEVTGKEISRSLEEGRGKMKKMMGMMMMGMAAKMAGMVPLAIAGLFLMAGKALMMAKIALLLSVIIALKKIVASKNSGGHGGGYGGGHGGGGGGGGWQSSGGGWDKRSYEEAQKLAYKSYIPH